MACIAGGYTPRVYLELSSNVEPCTTRKGKRGLLPRRSLLLGKE
jgi:hypothetical protein